MQFLDKAGLTTLVNWANSKFATKFRVVSTDNKSIGTDKDSAGVTFTGGLNKFTVSDGTNSFDVAVTSTDAHVTSVSNHYTPTGGSAASATAGTAVGWGGSAVTGVTVDAAGHVTGVTTGAIPANPVSANTVTSSAALTANQVVVGNGSKTVKASGYTLGGATLSDATGADKRLATEAAVADAVSGLSGAMHYIGTSTSEITDGGTQNPTISGYSGTAKTAGNVVIYGSKEFVWNGSAWEEFGDEGSYALKTVSVTGTGALSGGGTLTENRTITHNTSGATAGTYGPGTDVTGSEGAKISVPEITVDEYGHITAISNKTYTSKNTTYTALKNPHALTISHAGQAGGPYFEGCDYDGSSAKGIYFSSAPATNTNVEFSIEDDGSGEYFITGTVTDSGNTDRYVNSAAFASQGTNGASGTKMTLTRAGSDTQTVTATIPVATTSAAGVMSGAMVTKLNGIEAGAQANVKPDWNAASGSAAEILNKPTIPAAANNAKLQIKGSASGATATDTGFTANASSNGVITFAVGTGNTISSITTSGGTVTINGATMPDVDTAIPESELLAILYPSS